jgi:hypothetical protein
VVTSGNCVGVATPGGDDAQRLVVALVLEQQAA